MMWLVDCRGRLWGLIGGYYDLQLNWKLSSGLLKTFVTNTSRLVGWWGLHKQVVFSKGCSIRTLNFHSQVFTVNRGEEDIFMMMDGQWMAI